MRWRGIAFYGLASLADERRLQLQSLSSPVADENAQRLFFQPTSFRDTAEVSPCRKTALISLLFSPIVHNSGTFVPHPSASGHRRQRMEVSNPTLRGFPWEDKNQKVLTLQKLLDIDEHEISLVNKSAPIQGTLVLLHGKSEDGRSMSKRGQPLFDAFALSIFPTALDSSKMGKPSWFEYGKSAGVPAPSSVSNKNSLSKFERTRARSIEDKMRTFNGFDSINMEKSITRINALIDELIACGVSSERIVLGGFSQGGCIALRVALAYPRKLGGCILMSTFLGNRTSLQINPANQNLRVFHCHGENDIKVPIELGRKLIDALKEKNINAEFKTYDSLDHSVPSKDSVAADDIRKFSRTLFL